MISLNSNPKGLEPCAGSPVSSLPKATGVVSEPELIGMRDRMVTRGPDDAGIFTYRDPRLSVALGHRRLSILDLSSLGHQPMSTADGSLWIVFNGEIFNYRELRSQLCLTTRHRFKSRTDTEVILYGVREWGLEECLARLRGMYAFALFDKIEGSLTLVRDPIGVKPLYFVRLSRTVAFASEIKALLCMPGVEKCLNEQSLCHYLTFANTPAPHTLFKGVRKLEAANYLTFDQKGSFRKVQYWDSRKFEPRGKPLEEWEYVDEVRRLLRQSVDRRMLSDVPFGAFLSGGIDSTLNVALMAEIMDRPVRTFSVGIAGDPANELHHARHVASLYETEHHELVIDEDDFLSFLPSMALAQDEPVADPVCVPLHYLCKLARESGTTVVQVGEGSDEVFAGYEMFQFFTNWDRYAYRHFLKLPDSLKSILHAASRNACMPALEDVFRRALHRNPFFLGNAVAFWDGEKAKMFKDFPVCDTSSSYVGDIVNNLSASDRLFPLIHIEFRNRLPELLLMRMDKMSMANSVEARVPYLDEDLVEFALGIPHQFKIRNGVLKYILKKAAEGIVPRQVIYRKKQGFCGSATNLLGERVLSFAKEKILDSRLVRELFFRDSMEKLFAAHKKKKRFNSFKIWNLMNLVLWHEGWFGRDLSS